MSLLPPFPTIVPPLYTPQMGKTSFVAGDLGNLTAGAGCTPMCLVVRRHLRSCPTACSEGPRVKLQSQRQDATSFCGGSGDARLDITFQWPRLYS